MQVQICVQFVDFTRVGAVNFAGGSIAEFFRACESLAAQFRSFTNGVFLWSFLLDVFDSACIQCGFTVSQPKNAIVFLQGAFCAV
jgi:hypothetical protein